MPYEQDIKELQRRRRVSAQNIRRSAIIFGTTALVLLVLQYWLSMRLWLPFTVLLIVALTGLGDVVTFFGVLGRFGDWSKKAWPNPLRAHGQAVGSWCF